MEGDPLITEYKAYKFKFNFKQTIDGTVLGRDEEHAKQMLIAEFGEVPEFDLFELTEMPVEELDVEEDDAQLELPHLIN